LVREAGQSPESRSGQQAAKPSERPKTSARVGTEPGEEKAFFAAAWLTTVL
jgi:hypothetical protein